MRTLWINKILLTMVAMIPVLVGQAARLVGESRTCTGVRPAVERRHKPCSIDEVRWLAPEPPSAARSL